jgi:hypothetical protein
MTNRTLDGSAVPAEEEAVVEEEVVEEVVVVVVVVEEVEVELSLAAKGHFAESRWFILYE